MTSSAIVVCGLALSAMSFAVGACGEKKDPLTPDNPTADPLMLDAGGAMPSAPDTPPIPASGAPNATTPPAK
jgi:hypothetical protein